VKDDDIIEKPGGKKIMIVKKGRLNVRVVVHKEKESQSSVRVSFAARDFRFVEMLNRDIEQMRTAAAAMDLQFARLTLATQNGRPQLSDVSDHEVRQEEICGRF
jgi:hypothetical protein